MPWRRHIFLVTVGSIPLIVFGIALVTTLEDGIFSWGGALLLVLLIGFALAIQWALRVPREESICHRQIELEHLWTRVRIAASACAYGDGGNPEIVTYATNIILEGERPVKLDYVRNLVADVEAEIMGDGTDSRTHDLFSALTAYLSLLESCK